MLASAPSLVPLSPGLGCRQVIWRVTAGSSSTEIKKMRQGNREHEI